MTATDVDGWLAVMLWFGIGGIVVLGGLGAMVSLGEWIDNKIKEARHED